MSASSASLPANGASLVLTHNLRCRDFAGVVVQLDQNSFVQLFRIDVLPGWSVLQNTTSGAYAPVRDENVSQISVLATQSDYPPFASEPLMDSTTHDTIEADETYLTVVNDVVVCNGNGQPLAVSSGSVVSIMAHSPFTLAWFKTEDGKTFVVDARRPIRMNQAPAAGPIDVNREYLENSSETAVLPAPEPSAPADVSGEDLVLESVEGMCGQAVEPARPRKAAQPTAAVSVEVIRSIEPTEINAALPVTTASYQDAGVIIKSTAAPLITGADPYFGAEGGDHSRWTTQQAGLPPLGEADMEALAGTVAATPADFTKTDEDFCSECFAFTVDHADHCWRSRMFR